MENGETRVYDTKEGRIWARKISEQLYVANGVYCAGNKHLDMDDPSVLKEFMDVAARRVFPYPGAGKGYVLTFVRLQADPDHYSAFYYKLDMFGDSVFEEKCRGALDAYRTWAGIPDQSGNGWG